MRGRRSIRCWGLLGLLTGSLFLSSCGHNVKAPAAGTGAEPDKVLYDNAMADIKKGRTDLGRLALQTLMNTYPDSDYLAKAKLGIADSYYNDGGVTGLTQAVAQYEDFVTFFPFLDEAQYAQMQVGMAHYRRMEKADRDSTEALAAENAFQTLLLKYPDGPAAEEARQRLREVQEVLAEGEMRKAEFYFIRPGGDRASALRLQSLVSRYPLYSQADRAQLMLAQLWERHGGGSEQSVRFYTNIVKDYPLSPLVPEAKDKLKRYGAAVPDPDPDALARMKQEQQIARRTPGVMGRSLGTLKSGPDVSMAARTGSPNMTPSSEQVADAPVPGLPPNGAPTTGIAAQTVTPTTRR
jgi:outer membrane protein assembly factor BamD